MNAALIRFQPTALSVLRIVTALLFLEHGLMKLFAFPVPQPGAPHPLRCCCCRPRSSRRSAACS